VLADGGYFAGLDQRTGQAVPAPDFRGCGKTHVLYQGTTLVGPHMIENTSGFSPCGVAFPLGADFFCSLFSPGERVFKPARTLRYINSGISWPGFLRCPLRPSSLNEAVLPNNKRTR
jgi:hypothetical protein